VAALFRESQANVDPDGALESGAQEAAFMPLDHYGVLSGTLVSHVRDTPDDQGRWFHVNLTVSAAGRSYRCAIDVDSHQSDTGVEWRVVPVRASDVAAMLALAQGYHELPRTPASGAWDYIRSSIFRVRLGCLFVVMPDAITRLLMQIFEAFLNTWQRGDYAQASTALEGILVQGRRVLVWGEPFTSGFGQHNIHQNQGDPAGSRWWNENGIWQDGGTLAEQADGSWTAFISKFTTQAYRTDDQGHPAP
jgi:uncharacterized protein YukJ